MNRKKSPVVFVALVFAGTLVLCVTLLFQHVADTPAAQQRDSSAVLLIAFTPVIGAVFLGYQLLQQYSITVDSTGIDAKRLFGASRLRWTDVRRVNFGPNYLNLSGPTEQIRIVLPLYKQPGALLEYIDAHLPGGFDAFRTQGH